MLLHLRAKSGPRIEETARLVDLVEASIRRAIPPEELDTILDNIGLPYSTINWLYSASGTIGAADADILVSLKDPHHPTADDVRELRQRLPGAFPAATYRQTTLTAFQQVEDNLAALRVLVQEAEQQQRAVASAQESLELSTNRYKGGVDTYLQVITAQTLALTNERNAVDILRRRMDASVVLIKAIGGGWHVASLPQL